MEDASTFDRARRRARRLWLYAAALAAIGAGMAALHVAQPPPPPAGTTALMLIYVGADDCAPCRVWQNGDGADFRKSAEFARIGFHEVKSPRLHDLLRDEHWPEEIRRYRRGLTPGSGVPLWLIVSGENVVAQRYGGAAWRSDVLPALRSYLR